MNAYSLHNALLQAAYSVLDFLNAFMLKAAKAVSRLKWTAYDSTRPRLVKPSDSWIKHEAAYLLSPWIDLFRSMKAEKVVLLDAEFSSSNPVNWSFVVSVDGHFKVCYFDGSIYDPEPAISDPEADSFLDFDPEPNDDTMNDPERLFFSPGEIILDNEDGIYSVVEVCRIIRDLLDSMNHGSTCAVCKHEEPSIDDEQEYYEGYLNDLLSCLNEHAPEGYYVDFLPNHSGVLACTKLDDDAPSDAPITDTVTLLDCYACALFNTADPPESFGDYFDPEEFRAIEAYLEERYPELSVTDKEEQGYFGTCEATGIRGYVADYTLTKLPS